MAIQNDNTVLCKGDLKAYHEKILPYLGGNFMLGTNVSDYYSEDEKIVGVWTDGRPLYQITYNFTMPSANTDYTVAILPTGANPKQMYGGIEWDTNSYIEVNYYDSTVPTSCLCYIHNRSIKIMGRDQDLANRPAFITVKYTKSSDAANSAVATPGCYDINFPNTWPENTEIYFGNGLYGIHKTGMITATGDERVWTNIVTLSSGVLPNLVQSGGWIKWGDEGASHDYRYPINSCMTNLTGWGSILGAWSVMRTSDNVIALWNTSGLPRTNAPYNVWVTYTK